MWIPQRGLYAPISDTLPSFIEALENAHKDSVNRARQTHNLLFISKLKLKRRQV
jgi:hypothetical protein